MVLFIYRTLINIIFILSPIIVLIRILKKKGCEIKTILTKSAKEFVTPLSIISLSQGKVYEDLFNIQNESEMDHIALSRWADLILVEPATANTLSKLAKKMVLMDV